MVNFIDSNYRKMRTHEMNIKTKLIKKFNQLIGDQNSGLESFLNMDRSKWIVNKSSSVIPEDILNFLSLGGKFGLPVNIKDGNDRKNTILDVIKNVEASIHIFPEAMMDNVRSMIVNSLNRNVHANKHLSYMDRYIYDEFNKCRKFLKNNKDVLVTTADKGQVTVIMDYSDYIIQMSDIFKDDSTYRSLNKNPIKKISRDLEGMIKNWLDNKLIDNVTYRNLKCTSGNLPRGYGLPKIHKPGCPLRVVISSVGSPLYNVAKYLHNILSCSIKKPRSFIKDSRSFVEKINKITITSEEILVSLDVDALFTNIPKELVRRGIEDRWMDISTKTKMNLPQFLHAIDTVMSSTSFTFNGKFYEQIYGSPMGSPLSPILADIVMDDLENTCLRKLDFTVKTYFRYVDDIFLIIPSEKLQLVLNEFNNYHPRLGFTHEIECNSELNFLNTLVIRKENHLITNWYRKPTHSGRYINFYSNHPLQYRLNTLKNVIDQAILLSDESFHVENLEIVRKLFLNNGYRINIINKQIKDRLYVIKNKTTEQSLVDKQDVNNKKYNLLVPYVKKVGYDIGRIAKNVVNVCFTIPKKLNCLITKGKDRLTDLQTTEIVYKLKCKDCDKIYIGQTKRHLETRIKEHKNNIKNTAGKLSVVSNHRLDCNHDFDWEGPDILHRERNRKKREVAEMFYIKRFKNNVNLQKDTENLNILYDKVITI